MSETKPRQYTPEFRARALELAKELGSMNAAAAQLGVPSATMHGWNWRSRKAPAVPSSVSRVGAGKAATSVTLELEEENRRLRRELERERKTNLILKQAAAFFSQDHLK
jgi:transposase-like protein